MTKAQKESFVAELRERVETAEAVYLTDFTGLDVKAMTTLRRRIKNSGGEYLVVKNRLAKRALADAGAPDLSEHLVGPTGVVFGDEGVAEAAKAVADFAKENDNRPAFKAGLLEGVVLDTAKIARIAELPSKEVLLSQVAGALGGSASALAGAMEAKVQEFAGLAEALRSAKGPPDSEVDPNARTAG